MAQSINHQAEFSAPATYFGGLDAYGNIMTGDVGFEFFSSRNVNRSIQIPWEEVDVVIASVLFKGKWIPRIAIRTKENGTFQFASRQPKKLLRAIQRHVPAENMYRSWTFGEVVRKNLSRRFKKKNCSVQS